MRPETRWQVLVADTALENKAELVVLKAVIEKSNDYCDVCQGPCQFSGPSPA